MDSHPPGEPSIIHNLSPVESIERDRFWVRARVEDMFRTLADALLDESVPIRLSLRRRGPGTCELDRDSQYIRASAEPQHRHLSFPGRSLGEAWGFTVLVRILELIHEALARDIPITKRDIYYHDPQLFVRQSVVDRRIDDLACTLGVKSACLNVVSAAKGLMVGPLTVSRRDGTSLDPAQDGEGVLVPTLREIQSVEMSRVRWILVVEKEATFRKLAANSFWQRLSIGQGLVITAKGYPDVSTRAFIHWLLRQPAKDDAPPILALVDFDPDGIGIISTYKYGSVSLAHENAHLTAPGLQWIGLSSRDLQEIATLPETTSPMPMTVRDRRRAERLLVKSIFAEEGPEAAWRREVQTMLMLGVKAEIQLAEELAGGLCQWLERKMTAYMPQRQG